VKQLLSRQLPQGGWSYQARSLQAAMEPTCLSLLALQSLESEVSFDKGTKFLLSMQNPNGSWPAFEGDDREGSWTTSLALLALQGMSVYVPAVDKGRRWLLRSKGRESHWLWKWKFRTTDRHVRFDPDKFGWPWMPETNSWVVPTSFSLLALRQHLQPDQESYARFRIDRGIEMLLDRVCPGGGWNAGNGVVYGEPLAPHPDATAIALLALAGETSNPTVQSSLDWLEEVAHTCTAPWSLAWASMALSAHQRVATALLPSLLQSADPCSIEDVATLAAVALALQPVSGTKILGAQS
jgi:squalene cyclase